MKRIVAFIAMLLTVQVYGGDIFTYIGQGRVPNTTAYELTLNRGELESLYAEQPNQLVFSLPGIEGFNINCDLVRSYPTETDFIVRNSLGETVPYSRGIHYRGTTQDGGLAAISFFPDKVIGVLNLNGEQYELGRIERSERYVLFNSSRVEHPPIDCEVLEHGESPSGPVLGNSPIVDNCVRVYIECDYDMYLEEGSVTATVDQMSAIFNVVQTLYANENITTVISEIKVWDSPDGYSTVNTTSALTSFRNANAGAINGDIGHLVSRGSPAGGGVAWVDALCSTYNFAYSYIYSSFDTYPSYSWTVQVFTHEMGHNLGSRHTHDCVWNINGVPNQAIDGCGPAAGYPGGGCSNGPIPNAGTIMSYCHLVSGVGISFAAGFGPLPGTAIRNGVNGAFCLSTCGGGGDCTLAASINETAPVSCFGAADGSLSAVANNGDAPYSYVWSTGSTSYTISNLSPGSYSVTIVDAFDCEDIATYALAGPSNISITASATNETSLGANDGTVNTAVNGGVPPYIYAWSNGATSPNLTNVGSGSYDVTVTDSNGCEIVAGATVGVDGCTTSFTNFPNTSNFETQTLGVLWNHATDSDALWQIAQGPQPPTGTGPNSAYQGNFYAYASSQSNSAWHILQSDCFDLTSVPDPLFRLAYHMWVSSGSSLVVEISNNGGSSFVPFWTQSANQGDVWRTQDIPLGFFASDQMIVRIKAFVNLGQLSDIAIDDVYIGENFTPCPADLQVNVSSMDVTCNGQNNGQLLAAVVGGGMGPYSYTWSTGSTSTIISNLVPGEYSLTVTDQTSCEFDTVLYIIQPDLIDFEADVQNESAPGAMDGSIDLTIVGGTFPYNVIWADGVNTEDRNNLSAGTYQVNIIDANGCQFTDVIELTSICPNLIQLNAGEGFENDFGIWENAGFDRRTGPTPTLISGPDYASEGEYYIYSTYDGDFGDIEVAELTAGCFDLSFILEPWLEFDYHMFGQDIDFLKILASDNGQDFVTLTIINGQQGFEWRTKYVDLANFVGESTVTIKFVASMMGDQSNIGIDNIDVRNGLLNDTTDPDDLGITIYPNPNNGRFMIEVRGLGNGEYTLIDNLGRVVDSGFIANGINEVATILPSGMYVTSVKFADRQIIRKIIID